MRLRIDVRGKAALLLARLLASSGHFDLTESAALAEIRCRLETTGEPPPGTDLGGPGERFYVR